jgi:hypothetical protein
LSLGNCGEIAHPIMACDDSWQIRGTFTWLRFAFKAGRRWRIGAPGIGGGDHLVLRTKGLS